MKVTIKGSSGLKHTKVRTEKFRIVNDRELFKLGEIK